MHSAKQKPNIVFIVLDTHRRDRLGCYGYPRSTSPNIDAFAQTATIFEEAISPAQWTIPSHASMFSGEFPSTHMTLQANHALDPRFRTLAEWLGSRDYCTTAFCNNPLVGILNNGLKRGFQTFYNYGGAIRSVPARSSKGVFAPLKEVWAWYTQLLRKISYPVQNIFAKSDFFFQLAMHARFVSLWTRYANFKGHTAESLKDATNFFKNQFGAGEAQSHFVFINLMETHLPFTPPQTFVDTFAPYLKENHVAWDFMRRYNTQAARWLLPMDVPFSILEAQTLSDMYDAEVSYQDHLLAELLAVLDQPRHRENTLVIMVADHGEMLGEHQLMGHGFGVYQELIHVPLIIRFPGQNGGLRVSERVSTTQLFHTVLEVAGVEVPQMERTSAADVKSLSLKRVASHMPWVALTSFSEAYPPENVLKIIASRAPHLIEVFRARSVFRAAYEGQYKLIHAEGERSKLVDLDADPREMHDLGVGKQVGRAQRLVAELESFVDSAIARRPENWARREADLSDEALLERLRGLGYIE